MTETKISLLEKVADRSRADARAIIATAERVGERTVDMAAKRIKSKEEAARRQREADVAAARALAEAEASSIAARMRAEARQALTESMLGEALRSMADMPRDDGYLAILERFITKGAGALGAKQVAVMAAARDRGFLASEGRFDRIAAALKGGGVDAALSDKTVPAAGGAVVATLDGRLSYYSTFDEIAYRGRSVLKSTIAHELFE